MEIAAKTISLTMADAESVAFWRGLCPELAIEGAGTTDGFQLGDVGALMEQLKFEGYVNVPGVVPEKLVARLRKCIAHLHERRIPLAFAFVYDEAWHVFQGVAGFLEAGLGKGYRALPDFWAWHLIPSQNSAGWGPHRDRLKPTLDRDNAPHSMTVWLPFTDATPLNGCIYVLPAHLDDCFRNRVWGGENNAQVPAPQNIRALPATAGSMLAWNQGLLHWGGRASRLGTVPRTSAALEFQRGDKAPLNEPLLDPKRMPSFQERLGLIGKQILQYQHMYPLTAEMAAIGEALEGQFMPGGARSGDQRRRNPRLSSSVVLAPVESGYLAYDSASDQVYELNPVASLLAELCDGQRSVEEIRAEVAPLVGEGAAADVERWVEEGLKTGLLTHEGGASASHRELSAKELSDLAKRFERGGKANLAFLCQQTATQLAPEEAEAWSYLGYLAHIAGRGDDARAACERYLALGRGAARKMAARSKARGRKARGAGKQGSGGKRRR